MNTRTTNDTAETWTSTSNDPFERYKPQYTTITGPEGYEANIAIPGKYSDDEPGYENYLSIIELTVSDIRKRLNIQVEGPIDMYTRLVDENDSLIRTLNDVGAILKLDGDGAMKLALIKTRITV